MKERMGDQAQNLTDDMLAQISRAQMVQPIALMPGGPHNGFCHTNMYVDDSGGLKGLPNNRRATELAMQAGGMHDVRGDAFLGRIVDDGNDLYHRLPFSMSEVSSDAAWIKEAKAFQAAQDASGRQQKVAEMQAQVSGHNGVSTVSCGSGAAMEVEQPEQVAELPTEMGRYSYSQDDEEVTVEVFVPAGTTSKQCKILFKSNHIRVEVATLEESKRVVIDRPLGGKAEPEECTWGITDAKGGRQLTITVAKHYTMQGNWAAFVV